MDLPTCNREAIETVPGILFCDKTIEVCSHSVHIEACKCIHITQPELEANKDEVMRGVAESTGVSTSATWTASAVVAAEFDFFGLTFSAAVVILTLTVGWAKSSSGCFTLRRVFFPESGWLAISWMTTSWPLVDHKRAIILSEAALISIELGEIRHVLSAAAEYVTRSLMWHLISHNATLM